MIHIKVDEESFDQALVQRLRDTRAWLYMDLEKVRTDQKGFVFHHDYRADEKEIGKHLEALKVVIEWFGGKYD